MKIALLLVLSLVALAQAGPFNTNTNNNQIDAGKNAYQQQQQQQQQQQYMTGDDSGKQTPATEVLKQWCFASQLSQQELTASFKKLVGIVKSSPQDQTTEAAVMNARICQGSIVAKSSQSGQTIANDGADAQAHELIKDVYMDALTSCQSRQCMQQLTKIIDSNKIDSVRASYYMTRIAVTEQDKINEESDIKQLAESFVQQQQSSQSGSEAVERQKMFAVTATIGKSLKAKQHQQQQPSQELKQIAEQVAKTIVQRYIKQVSSQEVQQYQQQEPQQQSQQTAKKIAQRNAALKALANIPGAILKECPEIEQTLVQLAQNQQEQSTARQSAIECLEQNDKALEQLKQIAFDQEEPIEVRVAAYRAMMTAPYSPNSQKDEQTKQKLAAEIVDQVVKHCERNQQTDDQFVLYAASHLDNLRTSQQPEHKAIAENIAKNKQHYMQIQLLNKKLQQKLSDVRKSSRNYKLEQAFNQIESGLVIEGDLIYESKQKQQQQQPQQIQVLPKLARVNMSMPIMGETVNVVEVTLRQNQMDEELLGALQLVKNAKFTSETVGKFVDTFKSSMENQQQQQQQQQQQGQRNKQQRQSAEADLAIKVDGCTVVYLCIDDYKASSSAQQRQQQHQRNTRSIGSTSIVDELIHHLKRNPVNFNRGFNVNINERLGKVLDVDANVIAGLRFESRAQGASSDDYEIAAHVEPRFAFEAIVGPAKMTSKKLMQRVSTKTAVGLRLRYKSNELVDVQVDLPMNNMELFTVETQMVQKSAGRHSATGHDADEYATYPAQYTYLPESIFGQQDIYSPDEELYAGRPSAFNRGGVAMRKVKRSIFSEDESSAKSAAKAIAKFMQGKQTTFAKTFETCEQTARATGLRGKLRVVASPKNAQLLVQATVQKTDPAMQGYRVQVQKVQRGDQKQFIMSVSTPGSRQDRSMQIRAIKQQNSQRTVIKADVQSPKMAGTVQVELIHDGRQVAVKAEAASQRSGHRHSFEAGVQRGSQSQSGRIATTYKPYLSVESSKLKRPIQLQGAISCQQSPKTVITYELKCPTSGDFVQGKIILDERTSSAYLSKRASSSRRSMRSPIELLAEKDLTVTGDISGQLSQHAFKVYQMAEWDAKKQSLNADFTAAHKNHRKQTENQLQAQLKLEPEQQMITVQRKSPQQPKKEFRTTIASEVKSSPPSHQFVAEHRYNGKRQANLNSIVSYKHKVDYQQQSAKKAELGYLVEIVASEAEISEKIAGRTQVSFERNMKQIKSEMSSRGQSAKVELEYASLGEHQLEVSYQNQRGVAHRTTVRADQRQYSAQSRTEKSGRTLAKLVAEVQKDQEEAKLVIELPTKQTSLAADLKFNSGKLSSIAVQTPRFATSGEFSFETMRPSKRSGIAGSIFGKPATTNLRLKTNLKDLMNKEAYWIESAWNGAAPQGSAAAKSYLRLDSPAYRGDFEWDPREQTTKFGMFARSKRSIGNYQQLYSNEESILDKIAGNKLDLANKLWMVRSIVSSPSKSEQLKQQARRALFEYADRRQQHKHSFDYSPEEQRINFAFDSQPTGTGSGLKPMRFTGDLSTAAFFAANKLQQQQQQQMRMQMRPSTMSMESQWIDFDLDAKPFDGETSYAKLTALSRHPRSPFKKHESEYRYKKQQGYKASMNHEDSKNQRHSWQLEADESPKKWSKMSFESDKHGKGQWEHQYRKHQTKRSHDNEEVYANKFHFQRQSPDGLHSHRSQFEWDEPVKMYGRIRRDTYQQQQQQQQQRRYNNIVEYLKQTSARLNSQTMKNQAELYKADFEYQPQQQQRARLSINMPASDFLHQSSLDYEPTEQTYKLQSKLISRLTQQPTYELYASTKPQQGILGALASAAEQQFINEQHPMVAGQKISGLFKQPMKLDYNDKFGRVASFDYDFAPAANQGPSPVDGLLAGLRKKRAALYYKDDDFEHSSTYDFYPEAMYAGKKFAQQGRNPGDFAVKAQTKYGPVVVSADSDWNTVELKLESPVVRARLTAEKSASKRTGPKLFKLTVDNKDQKVRLQDIVRKNSALRNCVPIVELAKEFDSSRIEQITNLLVDDAQSSFKLTSEARCNSRKVFDVEADYDEDQELVGVKLNGQRNSGSVAIDMANKKAAVVVNGKRVIQV